MPSQSEAQALIESLTGRPAAAVEFLARTAESLPPSRTARVRRLLAGPLPRWPQAPADVRHVAAIIQRLDTPQAEKSSLLDQAASTDDRFRPYLTRRVTLPGEASRQRTARTLGEKTALRWMELPPRLRRRVLDELLASLEAATGVTRFRSRAGSSRRAGRGGMGRAEFIDLIAGKAEMTRAAAARAVDAIFDTAGGVVSEVVHGMGELSIPGFGKFSKKTRVARQGRNPRTGTKIDIPERDTISFTAGKNFREGSPSGRGRAGGAASGPEAAPSASPSPGGGWERSNPSKGGTGSRSSRAGGARSGGRGAARSGGGRGARGSRADAGGGRLPGDAWIHGPSKGNGGGPEDPGASGGGPRDPNVGSVAAESRRYTDVTVYKGDIYPRDLGAAETLPDDIPLVGGEPFTLGVAIRLKRTGIGATQAAPRGVKRPRKSRETVTIFVRAVSELPGVEIEEPLATLKWPYDADSGTALFRLKVSPVTAGTVSRGIIDVRLYDASLDLLDLVHVHDTVVPRGAGRAGLPEGPARHLSWPNPTGGAIEFAAKSPAARLATIHVKERDDGFRLDFIFRGPGDQQIEIGVLRDIGAEDLRRLLRKVRNFWTKLVIANYATNLTVTGSTFAKYLEELRKLGREAWITLFGNRKADQMGASERVGRLLADTSAVEGSRIQITYEDGFRSFVFPWSILYPAEQKGAANPMLFWGARYQIEQVTRQPQDDALDDEPINVVFALDRSFGNSGAQETLWKDFQSAAKGKLRVTDPISDEGSLFDEMVRTPPAHMLYFYCHGYASSGAEGLRPDGVRQLKRQIEALGKSEAREALETLFSLIPKMGDESWIYIGDAEITESTINLQDFFDEARRPLVFLNMCQSAELLPSMSSGLVRVFLDHNAAAIIGTESPMTAVFANAFAEAVFAALFSGDDVGTALWKARRYFLQGDGRNPLGLAYTLYGRATARLGSGPLIARREAPEKVPPTG